MFFWGGGIFQKSAIFWSIFSEISEFRTVFPNFSNGKEIALRDLSKNVKIDEKSGRGRANFFGNWSQKTPLLGTFSTFGLLIFWDQKNRFFLSFLFRRIIQSAKF